MSEAHRLKDGDSLRRCHERQCGRAPEQDNPLQKCSGCSRACYCSKACQRKDWKSHKAECRANGHALTMTTWDDQLQRLGFENLSAFSKALTQWLDAHKWALQTCVDVAVIRGCGIDSFQDPQRMVRFSLATRTSRNPSLLFQLRGWNFLTLEQYFAVDPGCRQDWERGAPIRASLCEQNKDNPLFVGLLPALFTTEGLDMTQFVYYPQFRTDPRLAPTSPSLDPVRDAILADLLRLSVDSINEGFPLRQIRLNSLAPAFPGRFVRSHGTWTWEKFFDDYAQYRHGQHRGLDETLAAMRSGFPPPEAMLASKFLAV
ncbi:hypothetical protein K466DRAFT_520249 [Polyporus arcularius HHB13444]|uniref:MYND-type domain-containing protein n=1 Tax=Polyporus arcularius HHB13444 TaxID=1314778 RepID=A0A5C3PG86_9APHY|nr:hypothetical protein K466DRAFT_520249 [Polyporus arcularius HHB13444]